MVQTLKILTAAYTSRIVRGQSTLKDVTERYFWNGLSRERLKAMKALYALKAMKALYALYAEYANVLVEKRTLVEKSKILNLKPNCIYSMQSIEQHHYRGYWNSQTLDRITDHANKFYKGKLNGDNHPLTINNFLRTLQIYVADINIALN